MTALNVRSESLPQRCEVCHQSDRFDRELNHCLRCASIISPTSRDSFDNIAEMRRALKGINAHMNELDYRIRANKTVHHVFDLDRWFENLTEKNFASFEKFFEYACELIFKFFQRISTLLLYAALAIFLIPAAIVIAIGLIFILFLILVIFKILLIH